MDFFILSLLFSIHRYEFSRKSERFWRKNRNTNSGASCLGVDLNRNWNYNWDKCDQPTDDMKSTCNALKDTCKE